MSWWSQLNDVKIEFVRKKIKSLIALKTNYQLYLGSHYLWDEEQRKCELGGAFKQQSSKDLLVTTIFMFVTESNSSSFQWNHRQKVTKTEFLGVTNFTKQVHVEYAFPLSTSVAINVKSGH